MAICIDRLMSNVSKRRIGWRNCFLQHIFVLLKLFFKCINQLCAFQVVLVWFIVLLHY